MKRVSVIGIFCILAPILGQSLKAQPESLRFDRLAKPDGLIGSRVTSIAQDTVGFMWFGTTEALNRYDGYSFKAYTHSSLDASSLSDNRVSSLILDRSGTLWVGTSRGLNRYVPTSGTFDRFYPGSDTTSLPENEILVLYESPVGEFWVGTAGGLFRFDREANTFEAYLHDPDDVNSLGDGWVQTIYEDRSGTLWIGTGDGFRVGTPGRGGLHRLERKSGVFKHYMYRPGDASSLISNDVHAVVEDRRGELWVGTAGNGLHRYNPVADAFVRIPYLVDGKRSILWSAELTYAGTGVTHVFEDGKDNLWITSYGTGLHRWDRDTQISASYRYNPVDKASISDDDVLSIYEDRTGVLWIGTGGGINKIDQFAKRFRQFRHQPGNANSLSYSHVWSVWEDHTGALWAGTTAGGLNRIDRTTGKVTYFRHRRGDPSSLAHDNVNFLYEDRSGVLWVGTYGGGLDRFDRATETFTHFPHIPQNPLSLSDSVVTAIAQDQEGMIWVGTAGGLNRIDPVTNRIKRFLPDPADPSSLPVADINVLFVDQEGGLWICAENTISRFNPEDASFSGVAVNSGCTSMIEDQGGSLWYGRNGLVKLDKASGITTTYSVKDGLSSNAVMGILEDARGYLWLSTADAGLSRFDPKTGVFRNYGLDDGLDDLRFSWDAFNKGSDGELFFGGPAGVTAFFPEGIVDNPYPPAMVITGLFVKGQRLHQPGIGDAGFDLRSDAEPLKWPYSQNVVAIEYAGLHYSQPERNQYTVMLEGRDREWRDVGNLRRAEYSSLPPGTYTFRAKAASSDGVSSEPISLRFTILPPWWRTPFAFTGYGLLLVASILVLERMQRHRLLRQERDRAMAREIERAREIEEINSRLLEHERRLEERNEQLETQKDQLEKQARQLIELDQAKSRLFANISHEFRTPLTLILGPVEKALRGAGGSTREALTTTFGRIQNQAYSLLHLVDQMLDLARIENGKMELYAEQQDLASCLKDLIHAFTPMAEREQVSLYFHCDVPSWPLVFDRDKVEKIVGNLLSNAIKFTEAGGKVGVSLKPVAGDAKSIAILIRDTGIGILEKDLDRLFDRFEQLQRPAHRQYRGAGLGLALAKELVEVHQGTISVESEVGFGSTFTVTLPASLPATKKNRERPDTRSARLPRHFARHAPSSNQNGNEPFLSTPDHPGILIVDDNPDVREYLRGELETDYTVIEAANGDDAWAKLLKQPPALIVSDVMMPGLDGFELCRKIKSNESLRHIPIMLLTALAGESEAVKGFDCGADDYLEKPFSPAELRARVAGLIRSRNDLRSKFSREVVLKPSNVIVQAEDEAFLERVVAIIEDHISDSHFGVSQLADELGVSSRQLGRKIRATTEKTPTALIWEIRLTRAAQLLQSHSATVAEVAYRTGFKSPSHFSTAFRRKYGVAPRAFADLNH